MKTTTRRLFSLALFFFFCTLLWLPCLLYAQLSVSISATNVSCFGGTNGLAKAVPSGGITPYTYTWSNNRITQTIQNLSAGTYTVTVQDAAQSLATLQITITQPSQLGVTIGGQSQICDVAPDGWAAAIPYGGTPAYTYQWNTGATTPQINNLVGGTYTVTVTDAKSCTATGLFMVGHWSEGLWLMSSSTPATCAYQNGTAEILAMTGTAPYQYAWSNGVNTAAVDSLSAGVYTVSVSDANGCAANKIVMILTDAPLSLFIQYQTPYCLDKIAGFGGDSSLVYPQIQWVLNDTLDHIIAGQGTDSIQVQWAGTGSKTVTLHQGYNGIYCSLITYGLNVAVCAAANDPQLDGLTISPNPFSDFLNIDLKAEMEPGIEAILSDISGKIMRQITLDAIPMTVPTSDLSPGFYFLKIKSPSAERVIKLSKL